MPSPFASIASRVNSAVERRLANVEVIFAGGQPFGAILDRVPSAPYGVVDANAKVLGFVASRAPGLAEGSELRVDGVAHIVSGGVQPDEGGWLRVNVYAKA